MPTERTYETLPFYWHRDTLENDRRWLETIVRNAAPFTDAWTKARIVQLAYPDLPNIKSPPINGLPTYGSYTSEKDIAEALRSTCPLEEYADFSNQVDEDYVIRALNSWHNKQFAQATSRNFEVYADRKYPNIFLVVSTAPTSLNVDRELPPLDRFRPLFNIAELGRILRMSNFQRLTLRTHGYANPARRFYNYFIDEVESLSLKGPVNHIGTLEEKSAYIGYHWPGEMPLVARGLWKDLGQQWGIFLKFLIVVGLLSGIAGTAFYLILALLGVPLFNLFGFKIILSPLWAWFNLASIPNVLNQWFWVTFSVFLLWLILLQILRLVVYQRDRYRAIHYGAPDLAEFFWRLDKVLGENPYTSMPFVGSDSLPAVEVPTPQYTPLQVNLIGHSMGALLLVNVLRILSDRFGKEDRLVSEKNDMGDYLKLDKLILSSPDIPLEFIREGRNNYVRSAILRCNELYLFSSDRDLVLRYLSLLGNWFTEPSLEMSGLRLGNVYLKPIKNPDNTISYKPYVRIILNSQPAAQPTSAYDLFEKFNYIDCSEMPGVNSVLQKLNPWNGLIIDGINTLRYLTLKIDVHGGYHQVETISFKVLKYLITHDKLSTHETLTGVQQILEGTPIRFLPAQSFLEK